MFDSLPNFLTAHISCQSLHVILEWTEVAISPSSIGISFVDSIFVVESFREYRFFVMSSFKIFCETGDKIVFSILIFVNWKILRKLFRIL